MRYHQIIRSKHACVQAFLVNKKSRQTESWYVNTCSAGYEAIAIIQPYTAGVTRRHNYIPYIYIPCDIMRYNEVLQIVYGHLLISNACHSFSGEARGSTLIRTCDLSEMYTLIERYAS